MKRVERQLIKFLSRKAIQKAIGWLIAALGVAVMLLWNWKLVLATVAGVGLMLLVYFILGWNWQAYWSHWRQFFTGSQGKLTVAVGSGGLAALSTYIAASIWADSENRWLATGTILQGFGTVFTLLVLIWHVISDRGQRDEEKFEHLLQDLTTADPLKRLIAVRQLSNLANKPRLHQVYQPQLVEYFCLLLSREQEPVIREAVLKSLQRWGAQLPKVRSDRPVAIPLDLQRSPKRVYREF
jgi:hypothetical protein